MFVVCSKTSTSFIQQLTVHRFLPFGIMAGLALAAAFVCLTLVETHNQPTVENLLQNEVCQPKNEKRGDKELVAKV